MDAFYASCELSQYPELRGLPMVVGGRRSDGPRVGPDGHREFSRLRDYVGRGVLTTATYEARALGVRSGMPTMAAAKLAPNAILLPVNFDLYRRYSRLFKQAIAEISPAIEDVGIDEIFVDISALPDDSMAIARRMKEAVRTATGLTCSVGITPNKLLSKISSDLHKPDGITILTMDDIPTKIWPLPASKINGIGPKASARLATLGIHTIGELALAAPEALQKHFGLSYARWLLNAAHGQDDRPVVTEGETKSVSRETTFERDLHPITDRAELTATFDQLCTQVTCDLQSKHLVGRTIGIKLRFDDFKTVTRDHSLQQATSDAVAIRRAAIRCLRRVALTRRLRLLGIRIGNLHPADAIDTLLQARQHSLL